MARKVLRVIQSAMDPAWLKAELRKPGRSQAALARFMGVSQPVVNRICQDGRKILATEADKIRTYLIATGNGDNLPPPPPISARLIKVNGVVEAGAWREAGQLAFVEQIPVLNTAAFEGDVFALKVSGPSMNQHYADGSYVIVRAWAGGPLPYGKHVVVKRERADGLVECTIKELRNGNKPELWPNSDDPAHQKPVPYGDNGDITVSIVGRVIASLRIND